MILRVRPEHVAGFLATLTEAQRAAIATRSSVDPSTGTLTVRGSQADLTAALGKLPTTRPAKPVVSRVVPRVPAGACIHRGNEVEEIDCPTCAGSVRLKVFACSVHQRCTIGKAVPGHANCCAGCPDRVAPPAKAGGDT